jgi:hypothetical protein
VYINDHAHGELPFSNRVKLLSLVETAILGASEPVSSRDGGFGKTQAVLARLLEQLGDGNGACRGASVLLIFARLPPGRMLG